MNGRYDNAIFWSDEDGSFVAEIPELPGCMAAGATHLEAVAHAEIAIQECIDTANDLGRPVPGPKGRLHYASQCFQRHANSVTGHGPFASALTIIGGVSTSASFHE
jgi:predicted RNase H-like HicB family nuclease